MDENLEFDVYDDPMGPSMDREEPMDLDDIQARLKSLIEDAVDYAEDELASDRIEATARFNRDPMKNDGDLAADGRSTYVSNDVKDTVMKILPQMVRIFLSGKSPVKFEATKPGDVQWTDQATEYIRLQVLQYDNDGFSEFYSAFHDALSMALGRIDWCWDDSYVVTTKVETLTEQEFAVAYATLAETGYEIDVLDQVEVGPGVFQYTLELAKRRNRVKIEAVPPEERIISRNAKCIDDAGIYGRRQIKTVSDLVAMGYQYDQLIDMSQATDLDTNEERQSRFKELTTLVSDNGGNDPSMREIEYIEVFVKMDINRSGIAQLYKICAAGSAYEILEYEEPDEYGEMAITPVESVPSTEFVPQPNPHSADGSCPAFDVVDIQDINSNLMRAMFDSLSRHMFPDTVAGQGTNIDDLLNNEISKIIRARDVNQVREMTTPFTGQSILPVLDRQDMVKADRTGIHKATQGLDADTLQSTSPEAIAASVSAAQTQIEMIARIFSSVGMRRLFSGILTTLYDNQDKIPLQFPVNGVVKSIAPAHWEREPFCVVNTAAGRGTDAQRMAFLQQIKDVQSGLLEKLGPNNPLTNLKKLRTTLVEMSDIAGFADPNMFWNDMETFDAVAEMQQQVTQLQPMVQQMEQQIMLLEAELEKIGIAEAEKDQADALKKRMEAIYKAIEAVQTASAMFVSPDAAQDELAVAQEFINA